MEFELKNQSLLRHGRLQWPLSCRFGALQLRDNDPAEDKPMKGKKTFPNGFIIENVAMGDPAGKLAKAGKKVLVRYVGKLQKTGKIFDQTKGSKPFAFRLGVNEVIKG